MKLTKTASGKSKIKISRKEWESIGKKVGWMKTAMDWEQYMLDNPRRWRDVPLDDVKYNPELWKKAIIMTANRSGGNSAKVILDECPLENVKKDPGLWRELIYIEPSLLEQCPLPEVTQDQAFLSKLKNSQEVNSTLGKPKEQVPPWHPDHASGGV